MGTVVFGSHPEGAERTSRCQHTGGQLDRVDSSPPLEQVSEPLGVIVTFWSHVSA